MILVKILGKKEPRSKEDPLFFAFEKCKVLFVHFSGVLYSECIKYTIYSDLLSIKL